MTCETPRAAYPRLAPHDPSGGTRLRTITFTVDPGDSLTASTTLVAVNADGSALDVGETLIVTLVSLGRISASPQGDVWGVNYKVRYGTKKGVDYLLVATPWLASQPDEPQYDQTFALPVLDT
jgi:hypothetical protein